MPYIDPKITQEVKQMDLFTYLQTYEPQELVHFSGNVYCTRTHDSLKISNGKWCWHSRGIGGRSALDYLIKVNGMSFTAAVEQITGQAAIQPPIFSPKIQSPPKAEFALPKMDSGIAEVDEYLCRRGISRGLIRYCYDLRIIYQTRNGKYPNAVFVGMDTDKTPRYATVRGTRGDFKGDVTGSDKRYSFALPNGSENLHLFESAVDLLSFATLNEIRIPNFYDGDLLSLSGVYKPRQKTPESALPPALKQYLGDYPQIRRVHLHLDNDLAGRLATQAIMTVLPKEYTAVDEPPPTGKDYNDYLCDRSGLPRTKSKERNHER
ncbi:topoisomerase [Bacteroidia bacterium]|nr:topoisomerase [Bacteroidia bacterium]